jgi:vacuolar-type H+-ATPase subunit I/STV1
MYLRLIKILLVFSFACSIIKNNFSDNSELIEMLKFTIDTLKLNSNLQNSMLETLCKQIDEKDKEIEKLQNTIDKLKS